MCPLSWPSLSPHPHPAPLGHHGTAGWAPGIHSCFLPTTVLHTLNLSHPPLLLLCPQSILNICISVPALQIGSSVPFSEILYIRINIQYSLQCSFGVHFSDDSWWAPFCSLRVGRDWATNTHLLLLCWPFVCLLWRSAYSGHLPVFQSDHLFATESQVFHQESAVQCGVTGKRMKIKQGWPNWIIGEAGWQIQGNYCLCFCMCLRISIIKVKMEHRGPYK